MDRYDSSHCVVCSILVIKYRWTAYSTFIHVAISLSHPSILVTPSPYTYLVGSMLGLHCISPIFISIFISKPSSSTYSRQLPTCISLLTPTINALSSLRHYQSLRAQLKNGKLHIYKEDPYILPNSFGRYWLLYTYITTITHNPLPPSATFLD